MKTLAILGEWCGTKVLGLEEWFDSKQGKKLGYSIVEKNEALLSNCSRWLSVCDMPDLGKFNIAAPLFSHTVVLK